MNSLLHIKARSVQGLAAISLAVIFLATLFVSCVSASSQSKPIAGGPCAYKQYSGEAEIVSISRKSDNSGTYEIKFSFHPQKAVREEFARDESKQWFLVMNDFSNPSEDFVKKYDVKTGKRFPCYMKVITKGTCAPVMFDFPTINRDRAQ
jgi:hypothetical protein